MAWKYTRVYQSANLDMGGCGGRVLRSKDMISNANVQDEKYKIVG